MEKKTQVAINASEVKHRFFFLSTQALEKEGR